jgi:hypothetical protein
VAGGVAVIAVPVALGAGDLVTRTKTAEIAAGTQGSVSAKCPRGKSVVLGGFDNQIGADQEPAAAVTGLELTSDRTWRDSATNYSSSAANATAIAYCGNRRGLTTRTKTVDVPKSSTIGAQPTSVSARCPEGKRVAFGGFTAEIAPNFTPEVHVSSLELTSPRTWTAAGLNVGDGDSSGQLTAIAYCGDVGRVDERSASVDVPSQSGHRKVTARCPSGERVAFGGFRAQVQVTDAFVLIRGLERTAGNEWTAEALNGNNNPGQFGQLTALAYCR